jgi:hypothetical protein
MCEHGTTVDVWITVPADMTGNGVAYRKLAPIDSCISTLVAALESGGIMMGGSCCGHGKGDGEILLEDGRRLVIKI